MSTISNIMLALLSLKEDLSSYLNSNGWRDEYSIFLAGDQDYCGKEVVVNMSGKDARRYVGLPLITLETGNVRNQIEQLGDISGKDVVTVTLLVRAVDQMQLDSLGDMIRKKLTDYIFTVYDYRGSKKDSVGTAELSRTVLTPISDPSSDNWAEKYVSLINTTLELDSESFV